MQGSICLCMITKDEEHTLARCIRSAQGLVREIVVADTGSTDGTVALAKSLGARVYHYPWDGSFANARNFALRQAQSEWLLLLDADEALDEAAIQTITEFTRTTRLDGAHLRIRNYTGAYSPDSYLIHSAMRLLRNKPEYRYTGDIHEQIVSSACANISDRFETLDAVIHHFGYLDAAVAAKQKRRRNIPLLEKQLAQNPDDAFTLFNMGNEYLSLRDHAAALQYYEKSYAHLASRRAAFVPHLLFRMISCYDNLGQPDRALQHIQLGLREFPACTDYEFLRADILRRLGRYTLAIDSLQACLAMGDPPMQLEFLPGCGTYRASFELGELYMRLYDYARAITHYDKALSQKPNLYAALYRMGHALRHIYEDQDQAASKLLSCFADPRFAPNALTGADILITEGLYEQALRALRDIHNTEGYEAEIAGATGRALFFMRQYSEAAVQLIQGCGKGEQTVLRGNRPQCSLTLFALGMLQEDAAMLDSALAFIQENCKGSEYDAALLMRELYAGAAPADRQFEEEGRAQLDALLLLLGLLLKSGAQDVFDRLLPVLNYVDCKDLLVRLAQLYENAGQPAPAVQYVLRSIKELAYIDAAGAGILHRGIYR